MRDSIEFELSNSVVRDFHRCVRVDSGLIDNLGVSVNFQGVQLDCPQIVESDDFLVNFWLYRSQVSGGALPVPEGGSFLKRLFRAKTGLAH